MCKTVYVKAWLFCVLYLYTYILSLYQVLVGYNHVLLLCCNCV